MRTSLQRLLQTLVCISAALMPPPPSFAQHDTDAAVDGNIPCGKACAGGCLHPSPIRIFPRSPIR